MEARIQSRGEALRTLDLPGGDLHGPVLPTQASLSENPTAATGYRQDQTSNLQQAAFTLAPGAQAPRLQVFRTGTVFVSFPRLTDHRAAFTPPPAAQAHPEPAHQHPARPRRALPTTRPPRAPGSRLATPVILGTSYDDGNFQFRSAPLEERQRNVPNPTTQHEGTVSPNTQPQGTQTPPPGRDASLPSGARLVSEQQRPHLRDAQARPANMFFPGQRRYRYVEPRLSLYEREIVAEARTRARREERRARQAQVAGGQGAGVWALGGAVVGWVRGFLGG